MLVDATAFFLRDAHGVAERLRDTEQGHYRLDESRSALYLARTRGFPKNTEVEATLTFTTDDEPGALVRRVAADAQAVTVREHHSFVELPDTDYMPRAFDPRVGNLTLDVLRLRVADHEPLERRWILRHRLREEGSRPRRVRAVVEPIVYYVDNGAPEPIRQALVEGASWWNAGVRGGRIHRRLPGAGAAAGRRPDGRSLQRDPLGAPLDARLVVRRRGHRSAHRRDHQGQRPARIAAHPAGRAHRKQPDVAFCAG